MAKIVVIVGSVRSERNGIKVAKWVVSKLEAQGHTVSLVDPVELDLSLLDKMYKEMESHPEKLQKLQKIIKEADGYVPITPEYNHSISSALKKYIRLFSRRILFQTFCYYFIFCGFIWWYYCRKSPQADIGRNGYYCNFFTIPNIESS